MTHSLINCDPSEAFTIQMQALEIELHADGVTDGYEGIKPKSDAIPYIKGYVEGTRAKLKEVQDQLDLLLKDRDRYFQIYAAADDF